MLNFFFYALPCKYKYKSQVNIVEQSTVSERWQIRNEPTEAVIVALPILRAVVKIVSRGSMSRRLSFGPTRQETWRRPSHVGQRDVR